jgi:DNA-binding SARP family transcriptional activator
VRSFLRCDLQLQLLGDWLLTLAPRPDTTPPAPPRALTRLTPPPTGHHPSGRSTTPSADTSASPRPTPLRNGTPPSFPLEPPPDPASPGYNGTRDPSYNRTNGSGQGRTAGPRHGRTGAPGHDRSFAPGYDGPVGPGYDGTRSPGRDGSVAPSYDGPVGPGYDGTRGPRRDGSAMPGYDGPVGLGYDSTGVSGNYGSSEPGDDGPVGPGHGGLGHGSFERGDDRWFVPADRTSVTSFDPATADNGSHAASRDGSPAASADRYPAPAVCDPDPFASPHIESSPAVVRIDLPAGPRHLIALLALNGRCARTHAAATLWPDCTDAVAAARLRAVLWRLRHRHAGVPPLLDIGDSSLALNPEVVVDVHGFRQSAELLIRPHIDNDEAEQAAHAVLHASELLPGWYDDWVLAARERLQYQRLSALDALAARRRRQRRTHEALEAARAAIGIEPLHESAHRNIVETHLDNGDVVEAIQHYQRFQAMLDRELGLPPSALFREVVEPYLALSSHKVARTS